MSLLRGSPRRFCCLLLVLLACGDDAPHGSSTRPDAARPSEAGAEDAASQRDGRVSTSPSDAEVPSDADVQTELDAGSADAGLTGCSGPAPSCFVACSGDDVLDAPARCVAGTFRCQAGFLRTDCPASACFGVPLPGEVCESGTFKCRPEQTDALQLCPRFACPSCDGFAGPVSAAGCRCSCDRDAGVRCQKL